MYVSGHFPLSERPSLRKSAEVSKLFFLHKLHIVILSIRKLKYLNSRFSPAITSGVSIETLYSR